MNCPETQELLEWLLLGELEEARVRQADEHLARCPDCRAEKERLHLLLCEMQVTADAGGVPAGLVEKVCAAGKAEICAAARRTALWRAAAGAAAVAAGVLVVLGVVAWPPGPSRNQPTASVVAPKPAGGVVERWRYPGGPVKADPSSEGIVARGGSVYMLDGEAADARVVAVDAATGRPRWRSKARSAGYLEAGETRVYCLGGSADEAPELICLDAADGQEVWRYGYRDGQPAQAPCRPVAVRDRWVCWSVGREVLLLDARTGGLVWRRRPDGHGLPSRAPAARSRRWDRASAAAR